MNEFINVLTHGRRFKAAVKELSLEELKDVAAKLNKVIDDREVEEQAEAAANAERNERIANILAQIEQNGLSIEDLGDITTAKAAPKKRAPRPPKYQITVDGELITWTGQGRMPTVFKTEVEAGKSIDTFLIPGME
ncbi:H-NS family nucleoid-associated regulatory protein [Shewanella intestini]|uniref:DNA-binding protein n=1 Tax=Shewanella intestini TaxID=2017544 RepID=A0ABS5I144_9GAMM|nr:MULTISPECIES: H-NS family nucleoid-associated regulatory protein [Shewanella]MBR9727409.1 H-NS histone family protein [Shewanella intestini]MRG35541.1 H-NS histone family protein [Shewanella sp. XMDDZSB0408]